jgi:hypothetical protein
LGKTRRKEPIKIITRKLRINICAGLSSVLLKFILNSENSLTKANNTAIFIQIGFSSNKSVSKGTPTNRYK